MQNYEVPMAHITLFEAVSIILTSVTLPTDTPDTLSTWGNRIGSIDSEETDIFG